MINANDAARMVVEYRKEIERKRKEEVDAIFPEIMAVINDEVISAANVGQGNCRISLKRLSGFTDFIRLEYLKEKVEVQLTQILGYRVVSLNYDSINIIWFTDV